jgi:GTP-binding protein
VGDHASPGRLRLSTDGGAEADAADGPADAAAAAAERGRWLFAQPCRFVAAATQIAQVPASALPEIAFAGRSNVGKSSLVNALTGRTTLARTSQTPGRTRQINFFDLAGRLMLVDLPGYGYAKAAKQEIAAWTRLVDAYLVGRPTLRRVLLLIDARHGVRDLDRRVMDRLDLKAVAYQAVLTKADKATAAERNGWREALAAEAGRHIALHPAIVVTSATTGAGVAELRAELARLADWAAEVMAPSADRSGEK